MSNVFDPEFSSMPRVDLYRFEIVGELYPGERPMMLGNWIAEDREAYCGVYE